MKALLAFIDRIEQSKVFWTLLVLSIIFFFLRLPSLIEPHWYGDEGIYQIIGMKIAQGSLLYADVWDNKPPLLYLVYALFNGDQQYVRLFSLLVGTITLIAFFFLAKIVTRSFFASLSSTIIFCLLFGTPILEGNIANAENFMLLPTILAALLVYQIHTKNNHIPIRKIASAGLLVGIAFLFKAVAIFDLAAFAYFLLLSTLVGKHPRNHIYRLLMPFVGAFLLPLMLTMLFFATQNALPVFLTSVFRDTATYVTNQANDFLFPNGLLIVKTILLFFVLVVIAMKRTHLSKPFLFITIWISFALFSTFFSQLPYTHYLMLLLTSFCLLVGLAITLPTKKQTVLLLGGLVLFVLFVTSYIPYYRIGKTIAYYTNATSFVTGAKSVKDYYMFFDKRTQRDYEVASFIKHHIEPNQSLYIWGDSPQVYVLAERTLEQKYVVAYHILGKEDREKEIEEQLRKQSPQYIIVLQEAPIFPFQTASYKVKYILQGATIYEKIL